MIIRNKPPRTLRVDEPVIHRDAHKRPVTRRDFIAQGFMTGSASVIAPAALGLLLNPRRAMALDADILAQKVACGITGGAGKIPFICFDLAGGGNIAGSNVLIGGQGGQQDFLTTAAYGKMGLPGTMVPNASATGSNIESRLGLLFHIDSAHARGIIERTSPATQANVNGVVIPALSNNDTNTNPHNPMYGIAMAGAKGELLTLIGSQPSTSGGNSDAPLSMVNPALTPTVVTQASNVTGLVDTGVLGQLFTNPADAVSVLESMSRISGQKFANVSTQLATDASVKAAANCNYVKSAYLAENFSNPAALNPDLDPLIVDQTATRGSGIFSQAEYQGDSEFQKTAAIMKMVVNGYAGAGTITLGGYDYHGQGRATGELRDLRAGRCIGACLEYAARMQKPLMVYVFSDGGISAGGQVDTSVDGRNKFMWTSDNESVAATYFLVYSPGGRPQLLDGAGGLPAARHQQIGSYTPDGSVNAASSPAANNVLLLVQTVVLNYMALHGQQAQFAQVFPNQTLGAGTGLDALTAFAPIVNGTIGG
ncbi:MAG: general secretion pathway protein GspF [Proteobacteria bacterium]|nr:general secretion pathway protein GspF [Pseudomonadota bacterium]